MFILKQSSILESVQQPLVRLVHLCCLMQLSISNATHKVKLTQRIKY
jgi:hypothetical protein